MRNLKKKAACLYFVMNYAPEGADQVEAAYECYRFVCANEDQLRAKSDLVPKIKRKYPILKTQHLLQQYRLTDDRLMQLLENPTQLIEALYGHQSIVDCAQKQADIVNKVAQQIADLHELNLAYIQVTIIKNWLAVNDVASSGSEGCGGGDDDLDETFHVDFNGTTIENDHNGDVAAALNPDEIILRFVRTVRKRTFYTNSSSLQNALHTEQLGNGQSFHVFN